MCMLDFASSSDFGNHSSDFGGIVAQVEHVPHPSDGDCTCKFKLRWASGPRKGRQSTVCCADVCLLSNQDPTEHSMIKALMAQSLLKPEELGKKAKVQKKEPKAHQIKALKKRKQVVPKDITAIQTLTEAEEAVPSAKKQPLRKKVGIDAVEDNDTSPEQVDDAIKSVLVDIQQNHTEDSGDHLHESNQEREPELDDALKSLPARKRARHAMMQSEALVTNPILPYSQLLQKGVDAISPEPGFASYDEAEASSKHGGRLSRSSLPCDQNTEAGDEGYRNLPLQQPLTQISQGNGVSAAYASSMLLICNMEVDCSALDVMEVLCSRTPGIVAVHILPSREFESSTCGYVLYKDGESAHNALGYLVSNEIIIASDNDRWVTLKCLLLQFGNSSSLSDLSAGDLIINRKFSVKFLSLVMCRQNSQQSGTISCHNAFYFYDPQKKYPLANFVLRDVQIRPKTDPPS